MSTPKQGDVVKATCGTRSVSGIVVRLERGAFWVETDEGEALRFALLATPVFGHDGETSH